MVFLVVLKKHLISISATNLHEYFLNKSLWVKIPHKRFKVLV